MKTYRFEIVLGVLLVALFAAFWWWQAPGGSGKLTRGEVDAYIRKIEPRLPVEPAEKAEMLARFRAWGEADDGQPVYMLNLMRFYDRLKQLPGVAAMQGTPAQANAHYESVVTPIALRLGASPLVNGEVAGVGDNLENLEIDSFGAMIDEVLAFLDGRTQDIRLRVRELMAEAATREDFERAGEHRDALRWLEELLHPLVSAEYLAWREQLGGLAVPDESIICSWTTCRTRPLRRRPS